MYLLFKEVFVEKESFMFINSSSKVFMETLTASSVFHSGKRFPDSGVFRIMNMCGVFFPFPLCCLKFFLFHFVDLFIQIRIDPLPWYLADVLWKSFPLPGAVFLKLPSVVVDSFPFSFRPNNTVSKSSHPTALTLFLVFCCCYCPMTWSCPTLCNPMGCGTLASSPSLSPGVCSDSCPLTECCCLTMSSSATPFPFCLHSLPGSFPVSQFFTSGGQRIGAST